MAHLSQLSEDSPTYNDRQSNEIEDTPSESTRSRYILRSHYKLIRTSSSTESSARISYSNPRKNIKAKNEEKVFKAEILIDYNKLVLKKLSVNRKNAANVLRKNIKLFKTLLQQFNRPQRNMEELKLNVKSIKTLLDDLDKST